MIFGRKRLQAAMGEFETALRARDGAAAERGFEGLHRAFGRARDEELREAGPRLAAFLAEVPPGPRAVVAVMVGSCVERGADAVVCAPAVFAAARDAFEAAEVFCERWAATGGDLPGHEGDLTEADVERVGYDAVVGWESLPKWEMACVAMLNAKAVRSEAAGRQELRAAVERVQDASNEPFKCLAYALVVLDDEPLVVLDRKTGAGFAVRVSGIGDNFQLHTLLADALIGGGHLSGTAPSPQAVAVCRDQPGTTSTTGSFDLVGADGAWIWNEGNPSEIPLVDGVRIVVLDPPPYERSRPAGRFFPGMTGELVPEGVLSEAEAAGLLVQVAESVR
ncbi:hypothetical protein ACFUJR_01405 [Streptomyces sp. NPDC057271]|uniref:hypothetical protein n=1 Tax=unclassified Streptomyces TaxID=2593676 RepID=UPI0036329977